MSWLVAEILHLIAIAIVLFLIAALLAPFESLGWWAGWSRAWPARSACRRSLRRALAAPILRHPVTCSSSAASVSRMRPR